jgi:hypothetical protein
MKKLVLSSIITSALFLGISFPSAAEVRFMFRPPSLKAVIAEKADEEKPYIEARNLSYAVGTNFDLMNETPVVSSAHIEASARWSATGLPDGVSIDPLTGYLKGTSTKAGVFNATVRVGLLNGLKSASSSFVFTSTSEEPWNMSFTSRDLYMMKGVEYPQGLMPFQLGGQKGTLEFSYYNLPSTLQFNSSTGVITGFGPSDAEAGVRVGVTVKATYEGVEKSMTSYFKLYSSAETTFPRLEMNDVVVSTDTGPVYPEQPQVVQNCNGYCVIPSVKEVRFFNLPAGISAVIPTWGNDAYQVYLPVNLRGKADSPGTTKSRIEVTFNSGVTIGSDFNVIAKSTETTSARYYKIISSDFNISGAADLSEITLTDISGANLLAKGKSEGTLSISMPNVAAINGALLYDNNVTPGQVQICAITGCRKIWDNLSSIETVIDLGSDQGKKPYRLTFIATRDENSGTPVDYQYYFYNAADAVAKKKASAFRAFKSNDGVNWTSIPITGISADYVYNRSGYSRYNAVLAFGNAN